jgi:hypothetical protein
MMEEPMAEKTYQPGENYNYPLILKKLLNTPLIYSPERGIVYDDKNRYTYQTLNERIHRLANGLDGLGVTPGDVVAVFDYDSHRYLEGDHWRRATAKRFGAGCKKFAASRFTPAAACRRPVLSSVPQHPRSTCSIGKKTGCWILP